MRTVLGGHVHLARMIDKCRAVLAGTEGPYHYPCPLDRCLLEFAGLSVEQHTEAVRTFSTDDDMAEWFCRTARRHTAAELETWNAMMLSLGPGTPEQQTAYNALRGAVDPSRTDLTSWSDLQDLEEGRPVPNRQVRPGP